jgi:signal transduction histidine kinase/DNA-binding NtrC family response regulator
MSPLLRILYAEDDPRDADLTRASFAERMPDVVLEIVETGKAFQERLAGAEFDLLLLDQSLPDTTGLELLAWLVRRNVLTPVVLVTGMGDEELVLRALRMGAATYAPKLGNYLESLPDLLQRVVEKHRLKESQGLLEDVARRILYVEHFQADLELTLRSLATAAPHLVLDVVHTCADALARLVQSPGYDAALIDLRMPDQSGLDLVREAGTLGISLPPFVILTGKGDDSTAIASLGLGASDYLVKSNGYLDRLPAILDRAIAHARLERRNSQLLAELAERRKAEEALRARSEELATILDAIPSIVWIGLDPECRVITGNRAANRLTGTPAGSNVSQTSVTAGNAVYFKQLKPDGTEFLPEELPMQRAIAEGRPVGGVELDFRFSDGRQALLLGDAAPLFDSQGKVRGSVASFTDVTEERASETKRRQLEGQLLQSQKMEGIGSLAGGIAHDFNNLLSVILSYTGFAMEGLQDGDPLKNDLLEVAKAGERAASLTRQLLAFSRKQILQPVPLELNQALGDMQKMLRRIIGEDIELAMLFAPELGLIKADPGQIDQVIMNLVVNARDAMPTGGKLTIETRNVELDPEFAALHATVEPGPHVRVTITDTGVGMDQRTMARIFEPFFTTKGLGQGTGLGLSTVYGIVKQSQGSIWVSSEPGKGTTFDIYFRRESSSSAPKVKTASTATRSAGSETVLVVEDEESLRLLAKRILTAAGYTVLTAANGGEGLLLAEQHKAELHLLLTDVVMPRMSGKAFVERLATVRPGLKVLFMSGYTDDTLTHHGVLNPGLQFIGKPFSSVELLKKIREVLDGPSPGEAPLPSPPGTGD